MAFAYDALYLANCCADGSSPSFSCPFSISCALKAPMLASYSCAMFLRNWRSNSSTLGSVLSCPPCCPGTSSPSSELAQIPLNFPSLLRVRASWHTKHGSQQHSCHPRSPVSCMPRLVANFLRAVLWAQYP